MYRRFFDSLMDEGRLKFMECGEASCCSLGIVLAFTVLCLTQKNWPVRSVPAPSLYQEYPKFVSPVFIKNAVRCVLFTGVLTRRPVFS